MKRLVMSVILIALVFAAAGCAGEKSQLADFISDNEDLDWDGRTVIALDTTDGMTFEAIDQTLLKEKIDERLSDIETKYNCTILKKCISQDTFVYKAYVVNSTAAGVCPCDFLYAHGYSIMTDFAYSGILYPLTDLKDIIDYEDSEKYGTPGILEAAMYNGVPYAVQPYHWPGYQGCFSFLIAYNKGMIKTAGYTDLHEYYENETWTWETFENMLATYKIGEGDSKKYVFAGTPSAVAQLCLMSNGVKFADYIDGTYKSDIRESKTVKAIEWYQRLYKEYRNEILDVEYWMVTDFVNELTATTTVGGVGLFLGEIQYNTDIEFGLMPFPCGPDAKYGDWAQWIDAIRGFGISALNEFPDVAARIISDLCEPFDEFGGSAGLDEYYTNQIFNDSIDTEIYLAVGKTSRFMYNTAGGLNFAYKIADDYNSKSAQQIVDTYANEVDALVEEYILPNYVNYLHEHLKTD